MFSKVEFDCT